MSLLALSCALPAQAQGKPQSGKSTGGSTSAYSCTDASGRRLTSDRLIASCMDREQRQVLPNGTVRIIKPQATLNEQTARAEELRLLNERRRVEMRERAELRALLARYPNRAALDAAMADALRLPQMQIKAAEDRLAQLAHSRKAIDEEQEFYVKNPDQIPPELRRKINSHDSQVNAQKLDIANYNAEAARIRERFAQEAARLAPSWHPQPASAPKS